MSIENNAAILVLDPSCAQAHGHHLNSLIDLRQALAPHRLDVVVNRAIASGVLAPGLNAQPLFAATIYDEPGLGPRPNGRIARRLWKLKRWLHSVRASTGKAKAAASNEAAKEDWAWSAWRTKWPELEPILARVVRARVHHIIVPSSDVELICGLIDLRAQMPLLAQCKIHARLITLTPQLKLLSSQVEATPAYRARIDARLANVHLYVETPAMQRHFASNFGLVSDVYPYLLMPPAFHAATPRDTAAFGYFGGKRNEKGFSRLVPILEQVAARLSPGSKPLSFFIHASDVSGKEAKSLQAAFAALEAPGLAITFVAGPLETAGYNQRFSQTDVALLPYTGARYGLSGSGIASEALAMGKALVYAQGMSCADFCGPENAIAASDNTSFANAILDMARNIDRYRAGAASRAQSYQAQVGSCVLLKRIK